MGFDKNLSNKQLASYIVSQFHGNQYPSSKYIQNRDICKAKNVQNDLFDPNSKIQNKIKQQKEFYLIVWLVIDGIETKIAKWQNLFNVTT